MCVCVHARSFVALPLGRPDGVFFNPIAQEWEGAGVVGSLASSLRRFAIKMVEPHTHPNTWETAAASCCHAFPDSSRS